MFTDKVTLYNHYVSQSKDMWSRYVLDGVQVNETTDNEMDSEGAMSLTEELSVTIPYMSGYVSPKEFAGTGFTFGLDNLDVLVCGEVSDVIGDDFTISDLRRKYRSSGVIKNVKDNTRRTMLKHWRVVAK